MNQPFYKLPSIQWIEIRNQYPEAFKLFWDWITQYEKISIHDLELLEYRIKILGAIEFYEYAHFNRGDLYSFFDQRGFFVSIVKIQGEETFIHMLELPDETTYKSEQTFKCRAACEQDAFLWAFKWLNQYYPSLQNQKR